MFLYRNFLPNLDDEHVSESDHDEVNDDESEDIIRSTVTILTSYNHIFT